LQCCAVCKFLSCGEICNLLLTQIEGDHSNHPLALAFLSLPAADDSVCTQAEQETSAMVVVAAATASAMATSALALAVSATTLASAAAAASAAT
jgi:hypothetical protein